MENLLNFIKSLQFILMPHYWIMLNHYNATWEKSLNYLLDKYEFTDVREHTAMLGNEKIWVANYPYGCFLPYAKIHEKIRPSRLTVLRARKKIQKQYKRAEIERKISNRTYLESIMKNN